MPDKEQQENKRQKKKQKPYLLILHIKKKPYALIKTVTKKKSMSHAFCFFSARTQQKKKKTLVYNTTWECINPYQEDRQMLTGNLPQIQAIAHTI